MCKCPACGGLGVLLAGGNRVLKCGVCEQTGSLTPEELAEYWEGVDDCADEDIGGGFARLKEPGLFEFD